MQLQQAGAPVAEINPRNIQIFARGLEIPITVSGENDGSFDAGDYIEFFGERNDGKLDQVLYANPSDQPHDYFSLYTDTSVYYLTWSASSTGKRYADFSSSSQGLTPEPYFIHQGLSFFTDGGYYPGAYILAQTSVSEYTGGEGFLGTLFYPGGPQVRTVSTPFVYTGSAPPIITETYVAGRSNASSASPTGFNHHLRIEVSGNGATFAAKKDTLFRAYGFGRNTFTLTPAEMGVQTYVRFSAVNDLGAATDYQAPGYVKISYPRQFDLQNTSSLRFTLKGILGGANSLIRFNNSGLNQPALLSLSSGLKIQVSQTNGILEAVVPGAGSNKDMYVYDSSNTKPVTLSPVTFVNYNPANSDKNFVIITNKKLYNRALEYASYRNETGYKTLLATTEQLYDQFYYGIHHPLAIRNFCKFLLDKAAVKPQYLLLLGKGQSHFYLRSAEGLARDLVPTIGNPPSDNMLTSGLSGTRWEPAIPTGRIPATSPEDVDVYLNKLKIYEQQPDSLWRKNIIHVSGGNTLFDNLQWTGYQKSFQNISDKEFFGSRVKNFQKNVSSPVTDNLRLKIVEEINKGASVLSFFGHGSPQATEINFGEPYVLQNQQKLLVYLINGCNAGNPFTDTSLGEKMIFQPDKAAIGWLATSDEGVASYLGNFTTIFYRNSFKDGYGKSISENLKQTIKSFQNPNDVLNQTHSRQYLWQGDPALKFYSPAQADYFLENKDLFIYPENTTASADSFAVAIIAKNLGKARASDSLTVSVRHILPDNSQLDYLVRKFKPVFNTDTLYYYIRTANTKLGGNNKFIVTLDPANNISELSEGNNVAELNFSMPSNGVNILYPVRDGIASNPQLELKAESSNLLSGNMEYVFEIDTTSSFNSSWKKSSGILTQGILPVWKPSFSPENNRVYYWRVRINVPEDQGGAWQQGSFTYIPNSAEGWNQSHRDQFTSITPQNAFFNTETRKFEFARTTFITSIQTKGDDAPATEERRIRTDPGGARGYNDMNFRGFTLIAFNPTTFKPFSYTSPFNFVNEEPAGVFWNSGQYYFDINDPVHVDSLIRYIGNIPAGFPVMGHNGQGINLENLSPAAKAAFASLGVSMIGSVKAGEPYMFWGYKGAAPGTAIEKMADPASAVNPRQQIIKFEKEYYYPFTSGAFWSEKIGPASQWEKIEYQFSREPSDNLSVDVIGLSVNGTQVTLKQNLQSSPIDLTDVDATLYPYLKLRVALTDNVNRTPAQLNYWKVTFKSYPEGTINPELTNSFHSKSLSEGDSLKWSVAYQNISTYPTDSISIFYTLTKSDRSSSRKLLKTVSPLTTGSAANAELALPTTGLTGTNTIKLEFVPKDQHELYSFNNYLNQTFVVAKDVKEPLLDVFFDGRRITNNEIVSPKPLISINLLDDSRYLLVTDTAAIEVYIKKNGQEDDSFKRIYYSSGKLSFKPAESGEKNKATVSYHPDKFEDGSYTLKIKGKDFSGNYNPTSDFEIGFEVINESSISHFYPYPNPFSTSMKFVFTLTGEKVPDKLKVQILTSSGKIVREVLKEELGPLRIGNNISDFSWDGTDQFGDRLANGVYFFRVISENNDQSAIKHRATSGDQFFKNNFGKIYLMR